MKRSKYALGLVLLLSASVHAQQWYDESSVASHYIPFTWDMWDNNGGYFNSMKQLDLHYQTFPFQGEKIVGLSVIIKNDAGTRIHNLGRLAAGAHSCLGQQDYTSGGNFDLIDWEPNTYPGITIRINLGIQGSNPNYFSQRASAEYTSSTVNRGYVKIDYIP